MNAGGLAGGTRENARDTGRRVSRRNGIAARRMEFGEARNPITITSFHEAVLLPEMMKTVFGEARSPARVRVRARYGEGDIRSSTTGSTRGKGNTRNPITITSTSTSTRAGSSTITKGKRDERGGKRLLQRNPRPDTRDPSVGRISIRRNAQGSGPRSAEQVPPCRVRRGFTLIEIIVVLSILTILTAAVVPIYQGSITWARGDRAVRDFVALMKYGQERAITDVAEYRLYMDDEEGRYWLMRFAGMKSSSRGGDEKQFEDAPDAAGGVRVLPEGMTLEAVEARRDREKGAYYIAFHPSGACDYATVELVKEDGEGKRIETKGKLGQFEVTEL